MLTKHIPLLFSSDPLDGASNRTADGSEFNVELDNEDIHIPEEAESCDLFVQDAEFFYTFPNVTLNVNDRLTITYLDGINPLVTYNLQIPQGLYSINDLSDEIEIQLFNQPGYPEVTPLIELLGSDAQQKVIIKYNYLGIRVDLTQGTNSNASIHELIGFTDALFPVSGNSTANTFDTAQNVAKFNNIRYVLLSVDLVDNGIKVNNIYDFYVARILITVGVGEQQTFFPQMKMKIPCNNLIGKKLSRTRVKLLDQNGNDLNTNTEFYSVNVVIEFTLPV